MKQKLETFKKTVWHFYHTQGRDLPWRHTHNIYHIIVSELMLQQTQVLRVIVKYKEWIKRFPSFSSLAKASTEDVLKEWQGLGYNKRALYLKDIASAVTKLKTIPNDLTIFKGIGKNTQGAIDAYAHNKPSVFIETNIKTVFIHHFFKDATHVSDTDILNLVSKTVDQKNPREWYWALMDYGSYTKKKYGNISRKSKGYTKQSTFKGSVRETRATILRFVLKKKKTTIQELSSTIKTSHEIKPIVQSLIKDGFLKETNKSISIK